MPNKVLEAFAAAGRDPWAARDGNVLLEKLRSIVHSFIASDRRLVIEALRTWLKSSDEPSVVHAAILVKEFRIRELSHALTEARQTLDEKGSKSVWMLDEAIDLIQNS